MTGAAASAVAHKSTHTTAAAAPELRAACFDQPNNACSMCVRRKCLTDEEGSIVTQPAGLRIP